MNERKKRSLKLYDSNFILREAASLSASLNSGYCSRIQKGGKDGAESFKGIVLSSLGEYSFLLGFLTGSDSLELENSFSEPEFLDKLNSFRYSGRKKIPPKKNGDALSYVIKEIFKNSLLYLKNGKYNYEGALNIEAKIISLRAPGLKEGQIAELESLLINSKELWKPKGEKEIFDSGTRFGASFDSIWEGRKFSDAKSAFGAAVKSFVYGYRVLEYISDDDIINLYDRLKNSFDGEETIYGLLSAIHREAAFRYGHGRLSDSEYSVLEKFQEYDAVKAQIENAAFSVAEAFLLKKTDFIDEILTILSRNADNLRALGWSGSEAFRFLSGVLVKSDRVNSDSGAASLFKSINDHISKEPDRRFRNRYSDLDSFSVKDLGQKYSELFLTAANLIKGVEERAFLENSVVGRLAQNYRPSGRAASVAEARALEKGAEKIKAYLGEINFVKIFYPKCPNKIHTLNFKKQLARAKYKDPESYLDSVLKILLHKATSVQLNRFFDVVRENPSGKAAARLEILLAKQIRNRTTVSRMLYSFFSGRRDEFKSLKLMLDSLEDRHSKAEKA